MRHWLDCMPAGCRWVPAAHTAEGCRTMGTSSRTAPGSDRHIRTHNRRNQYAAIAEELQEEEVDT